VAHLSLERDAADGPVEEQHQGTSTSADSPRKSRRNLRMVTGRSGSPRPAPSRWGVIAADLLPQLMMCTSIVRVWMPSRWAPHLGEEPAATDDPGCARARRPPAAASRDDSVIVSPARAAVRAAGSTRQAPK
jgi:hypothetical protein